MKNFILFMLVLLAPTVWAQQPIQGTLNGFPLPVGGTPPFIVQTVEAATSAGNTVKTVSATVAATAGGNSLVVSVCAGEVVGSNIVLTIADTQSDTFYLAATEPISTTLACSIYWATNIVAGSTAVTATFSGSSSADTSIAEQVYEVRGLISLIPSGCVSSASSGAACSAPPVDTTAINTATGTAATVGYVIPSAANDYAFTTVGVGTTAETITFTEGTPGAWAEDSGQITLGTPAGLYSFKAASQLVPQVAPVAAVSTIGASKPWTGVLALFRPVILPAQQFPIGPSTVASYATPVCTAAMTGTTATVTLAAPAAGLHNYIDAIIVTNSSTSIGTFVTITDGSGGTIIWEGEAAYGTGGGGGFTQSFPNGGMRQPTAGNGVYAADVTTGANVIACVSGHTGP